MKPPRVYEGADRAAIIWEAAEVDLFCRRAPEQHADAVRLARETGLRIGDLVELERRETKTAPETAAKMLGVYAALNPGRAMLVARFTGRRGRRM